VTLLGVEIDHGKGKDKEDGNNKFIMPDDQPVTKINKIVYFFCQHPDEIKKMFFTYGVDEIVKSQNSDGKEKSSSSRRANPEE
jgi:hypothetical protein